MSEPAVYVPSEEALKFIAFIRAAGLEENISPEAHYKIADKLFSKDKQDWNVLIECLRGMGKSSVLEYAVIYVCALGYWPNFGACPLILFLGASQEGNTKAFFKNVAGKIFASDFLKSLFKLEGKDYRQTDSELELTNQAGVLTYITGRGCNVNFRGIRSPSGSRVSVVVADDIITNESMTSAAIRNTIETNWFNSVLPSLVPKRHKIIYIGTPINEEDLLHKLKDSGSYQVVRFPLCPKFPCPEEEFVSIWPDRFDYEYVSKMYKQFEGAGKTQAFYQEYMLEITDLTTLLVDEDDVRWFDRSLFLKNKHQYNFYITTDFATSTKKSADFTTVGVWAISSNGDWLLVDGICKRQTVQETLEDIFKLVSKWKPVAVGIETAGQQGGFISIIETMMMDRNIWFQFATKRGSKEKGIRPATDKVSRFVTGVQPMFKQGKVWLPRPESVDPANYGLLQLIEELVSELSKFTLAGGVKALAHDDAIDLLNQLSEIDVFVPDGTFIADENITKTDNDFWGSHDNDDYSRRSTVF